MSDLELYARCTPELRAKIEAKARREALKEAAEIARHRHNHWSSLGNSCLVDDDISACGDIADAILAARDADL